MTTHTHTCKDMEVCDVSVVVPCQLPMANAPLLPVQLFPAPGNW